MAEGFVLVVVLAVMSCARASRITETCHFVKTPDAILFDDDLHFEFDMSLADCHQQCQEARSCVGFNYQESTRYCSFTSKSKDHPDAVFTPNTGTDFYGKECFQTTQQQPPPQQQQQPPQEQEGYNQQFGYDQSSCAGFLCRNDRCVDGSYTCDGLDDCGDGSDEQYCSDDGWRGHEENDETEVEEEEEELGVIKDGYFLCKNGNKALAFWRCDGDDDCGDLSDEEYCGENLREWNRQRGKGYH